ncbi:MAG TPA: PorV/PorQ family protein [bacterium]|nr:PorV/PorQ family protein [bacterium]HOZ22929.1 PorV/PorQ family protein [bacterium]
MKLDLIKIFLIALLLTAGLVQAQVGLDKIAQSTMNFQQVGLSARASGLGEAFCAVGRGAEAVFYNPAGVVEAGRRLDLKFYSTEWIADINYMAGALTCDLGRYGAVGLSFLNVDYGDIYTTSLLDASESALYPEGYKDTGLADNVGAWSLGLTYGRAISTQFLIAGNARLVSQSLGTSNLAGGLTQNDAVKLVFDAGVKYYTGIRSFRFGMAIRNFSSNLKREEINEQLPLTFTMGAALDLLDLVTDEEAGPHALTLSVDFVHPNNYSERVNAGMEYLFMERVAVRAGYQGNNDITSWSAGFGLHTPVGGNDIYIDYSYSFIDTFDSVNRFALGVGF